MIFIISLAIFVLFFSFLALGYIIRGKRLKREHDYTKELMDTDCEFCDSDPCKKD